MKIRAEYYLVGGTVHIATNGVLLCTLGGADSLAEHVVCPCCGLTRFERLTRDEARSRIKCGDCLRALLELKRLSDFLEALPTIPSPNN